MPDQSSNIELADQLSQRRTRILPMLAMFFLFQQFSYFSHLPGDRTVDHVRIGAWVLMSTVLLAFLISGGAWSRSKTVRALINDEVARANRAAAIQFGFLLAMAGAIVLYPFIDLLELNARQVLHLIVSLGLAAAMLRFAMLERRALG